MALLFFGMLQKFLGHALSMNTVRHIVVPLVAEDADDLGGQRLIQDAQGCLKICLITFGDSAPFHMLPGAAANFFDVAQERFFRVGGECGSHGISFSSVIPILKAVTNGALCDSARDWKKSERQAEES